MKTITTAAGLLLALSAFGGSKDPKPRPRSIRVLRKPSSSGRWRRFGEVGMRARFREIYLTVTVKTDTVKVYVGPKEFVNLFGVKFSAGEEIEVTGAKAQFEGGELILGKEIVIGRVTLILRDESGWPNWDYNKPESAADGPVSRRMID